MLELILSGRDPIALNCVRALVYPLNRAEVVRENPRIELACIACAATQAG